MSYFYLNEELYHFGVKGKGSTKAQTKVNKLTDKINKQQSQLEKAYAKGGVLSNEFRDKAKQLNVTKHKRNLEKLKTKDNVTESDMIVAKQKVKEAKNLNKYGTYGQSSKDIYDPKGKFNLTKNDLEAISIKEADAFVKAGKRDMRGRQAITLALAAIGSLAISVVASEAKYKKNYGKFGKIGIGKTGIYLYR